jgi:DivIVA domain-containing protein
LALDRQSIEKKDFPIGRRGYDPDAVDEHLAAIAAQVEELKLASRRRSETLASAASEQVRAIVEAAESSAAEIQRVAEEEAREIRAEAAEEAKTTREQATAQARDYVARVSESTAAMLQRLDAMESELSALIEALRTGGNRLNADLQLLESGLGEVRDAVVPRPQFEPEEPAPPPVPERAGEPGGEPPASAAGTRRGPAGGEAGEARAEQEEISSAGAGSGAPNGLPDEQPTAQAREPGDEAEGARLIALNMALNGSSRAETSRYLAENFTLADPERLLDEVFAAIEG